MARKKRATRPKGPPQPMSMLIGEVFKWLKLDEPARAFRALRAFSQAAGPRINSRARAERLRGATLYVRVSSSGWSQELHTLKSPLLSKLRRTPGGEVVEDLRFSVGPLEDVPDWEAMPEPFVGVPAPAVPEDEAIGADLANAVEGLSDPELREEFSRLLALSPPKRSRP